MLKASATHRLCIRAAVGLRALHCLPIAPREGGSHVTKPNLKTKLQIYTLTPSHVSYTGGSAAIVYS